MKVYLVIKSIRYEGDNFIAAYAKESAATEHVKRENAKEQGDDSVLYVKSVDVIE